MSDKPVLENDGRLKSVVDCLKKFKMCIEAVGSSPSAKNPFLNVLKVNKFVI